MQSTTLITLLYASLIGAHSPCPTITSTTSVCSTCIRPQCMALKTITPGCGCPQEVAVAYTDWPCDQDCPGGCAGTEYITATADCEPTGCPGD